MANFVDMTAQTYGDLRIVGLSHMLKGRAQWRCACACGREVIKDGWRIRQGLTRSCGCMRKGPAPRHGMTKTLTHRIWCSMRERCQQPSNKSYADYGGRGIKVCDRWASFDAFLADMGPAPEKRSIERLDVNGDYEPTNCCWIPMAQQARNRRSNRHVILNGERMLSCDAAKTLGVSTSTISLWVLGKRNPPVGLNFRALIDAELQAVTT